MWSQGRGRGPEGEVRHDFCFASSTSRLTGSRLLIDSEISGLQYNEPWMAESSRRNAKRGGRSGAGRRGTTKGTFRHSRGDLQRPEREAGGATVTDSLCPPVPRHSVLDDNDPVVVSACQLLAGLCESLPISRPMLSGQVSIS